MDGYEGIVDVIFQTMTRVLEQHAGDSSIEHHLIADRVFLGSERVDERAPKERDLHPAQGLNQGALQAETIVKQLVSESSLRGPTDASQKEKDKITEIKNSAKSSNADDPSGQEPETEVSTSTDTIYLRLQPTFASLPYQSGTTFSSVKKGENLFFVVYLHDPVHDLIFTTLSQSIPSSFCAF